LELTLVDQQKFILFSGDSEAFSTSTCNWWRPEMGKSSQKMTWKFFERLMRSWTLFERWCNDDHTCVCNLYTYINILPCLFVVFLLYHVDFLWCFYTMCTARLIDIHKMTGWWWGRCILCRRTERLIWKKSDKNSGIYLLFKWKYLHRLIDSY
jgi:hypothetical protein